MSTKTATWIKRILIAVAALITLALLAVMAVATAIFMDDGHNAEGRAFDPVLKDVVRRQDFTATLNAMTPFGWETVCWLQSYDIGPFEPFYGSAGAAMEAMPWTNADSHWGLVFVDGAGTVTPVSVSRRTVDIADFTLPGPCLCGEVTLTRTKGGPIEVGGTVCEPRLER